MVDIPGEAGASNEELTDVDICMQLQVVIDCTQSNGRRADGRTGTLQVPGNDFLISAAPRKNAVSDICLIFTFFQKMVAKVMIFHMK